MYFERRLQPFWMLVLGLVMTYSLGVAYGSVLYPWIGYLVGLVTSVPVVLLWWRGQSNIQVSEEFLIVGKLKLPIEYVGQVQVFNSPDFLNRIRTGATGAEMLSLLGQKYGGVVVENLDATDPYRQWVIASKSAEKLQTALRKPNA
jgi:hypothetical protein